MPPSGTITGPEPGEAGPTHQGPAPGHMKRLRGWVKDWYERIKAAFGKTTDLSYEARLMNKVADDVRKAFGDLWDAALQEAVETHREVGNLPSNKNTAQEGGVQFSIRQTNAGQLYVQAERQVLSGDDPVQWGYQIENYINQTIRNGHDFVIPTRDGTHFLALTSRSAYKLKDRNIQSIRRHDVEGMLTEEQYHLKGVAATHIDELIQVAIFSKYEPDINGWHENDIGEDGFNYFTSFFRDFDGKYYRVRFSSAINGNDETTYSIGDIRERRFPTDAGSSSQGEALKSGGKSTTKNNTTGQAESQGPKTALAAALEKAQQEKAQREKRSDRDYNQTVVLTEQTIDKYLADYAAKSSPNYAQAYIVQMRPDDFLSLTTSKVGRDRIYRETGELDVEKLKDASIHQPFQLIINTKTGQVEGHEGRRGESPRPTHN